MKQIDGGLRLAIEAAGDRTRVPELMPVRYERMLVSPFTFLRGAAASYSLTATVLFLRRNHADPLVVLPWSTWAALLEKVRR
jgi:hypothetical protein